MSSSAQQPTWRRIYLQTLILTHKNMLIFYKAPMVTVLRAFLFPIAATLVFSLLIHLNVTSLGQDEKLMGISLVPKPILTLASDIDTSPSKKLVFVTNGLPRESLNPIIAGVMNQPGMSVANPSIIEDSTLLFTECRQITKATSNCFAAVVFTAFNETNVDYSIAVDGSLLRFKYGDYRKDETLLQTRILPLQWAIESQIGNFTIDEKPLSQTYSGYFGKEAVPAPTTPAKEGPRILA
ncbi:hypothetical protein WAI453_012988 [Rhynchosporium graminicola]